MSELTKKILIAKRSRSYVNNTLVEEGIACVKLCQVYPIGKGKVQVVETFKGRKHRIIIDITDFNKLELV